MARTITGEIAHTEKTIQRMFEVEYHTYEKLRMLSRAVLGGGLIVASVLINLHLILQGVLMLAGCWFLISPDFPADCRADQAFTARRGVLPIMKYTFTEQDITLRGEGVMQLGYDRIQYLVEDDGYFYLFLGKNSVCMVDKDTLVPASSDSLKTLLSEKTGLEWTRDRSLLSMNLQDILRALKARRRVDPS